MTTDEAMERLRAHWGGRLSVEEQQAVVTVSNRSREQRAVSPLPGAPMPRVYEAPNLFLAVMTAIRGEDLDR